MMRIVVLKTSKALLYLSVLVLLIVSITVFSGKDTAFSGAFSANREIPIYRVEASDKTAAITFDCAWGAEDIEQILSTLKQEDVKATFFIVGQWAEKYPEAVKMIAQDGHDIANHSYSHLRMGTLPIDKITSEINQCNDILEGLTKKQCDLFRAPYGDYNNDVLSEAKKQGFFTIQWNVDSLDWKPGISKDDIMQRIRERIVPGSIVLFHNDTPHTAKLLPDILSEMKSSGYNLVPVSTLILREDYYIDHDGCQKKTT